MNIKKILASLAMSTFTLSSIASTPNVTNPDSFDTSKLKTGVSKEWVIKHIPGYEGSTIDHESDDPSCIQNKMISTFKNKHGDVLRVNFCESTFLNYKLDIRKP